MNIAIIGAGLTGLSIAKGLLERGHEVDVFEKSRGSGGRISTKRLDFAEIDMGAQYFTARDPEFKQWVQQWCEQGVCSAWQFTPYTQRGVELQASPDCTQRYVGLGGMNRITRSLAQLLRVHYQAHIQSVEYRDQMWVLHNELGECLGEYDWLICSQPIEQTRQLIADKTNLMGYLPSDVHLPCWALALKTYETGHDRDLESIQGIFAEGPIKWISRAGARPGQNTLTAGEQLWLFHFDGLWSQQQGSGFSDKALTDIALQWLNMHLPAERVLMNQYAHFWRYGNLSGPSQTTPALIDSDRQLMVAGAWAAGGTVEGAYLSSRYCLAQFLAINKNLESV